MFLIQSYQHSVLVLLQKKCTGRSFNYEIKGHLTVLLLFLKFKSIGYF